jgi:purine-binding chemotaxis protein CheW
LRFNERREYDASASFDPKKKAHRVTPRKAAKAQGRQMALVVRVGESLCALPIEFIDEILPALPVEEIPQCPQFIRGVVFVRGRFVPVLDAAERLGMRGRERPWEPHIVCLSCQDRLLGVEVDEALDLVDLSQGARAEGSQIGAREGLFAAVVELGGQVVRLLRPERLLTTEEAAELDASPRPA